MSPAAAAAASHATHRGDAEELEDRDQGQGKREAGVEHDEGAHDLGAPRLEVASHHVLRQLPVRDVAGERERLNTRTHARTSTKTAAVLSPCGRGGGMLLRRRTTQRQNTA